MGPANHVAQREPGQSEPGKGEAAPARRRSGSLAAATGRRPSAKGTVTRTRVVEAAEACISELGFNRASSGEVTRRSGVTFGVIQYHFGSYENVLLAVVERAAAGLRQTLAEVDLTGRTTTEKVAAIADVVWSYYERPQYLSYMEIHLNLQRDPATSDRARRSLAAIDREIEERWHDLVARVFGDTEDEVALQRLLFGAMRGMAISRWLNRGRLDFRRERQLFVEMLAGHLDRQADR